MDNPADIMITVVLASTSPRRQQLLAMADLDFVIHSAEVDETVQAGESPQDYIVRMVGAKAVAACHSLVSQMPVKTASTERQLFLVITSDTIGVLPDGRSILVKPIDKEDAFRMWQQMSDTEHAVWTAVQLTLIDECGQVVLTDNLLEKTAVKFIALNKAAMEDYWRSGEPADKAGGYAIQGKGAAWVERINGSYSNVVGLPLAQTLAAIKRMQQQAADL